MPPILDEIVANKRQELAKLDRQAVESQPVAPPAEPFRMVHVLQTGPAPRLILEIKPASPSAGVLQAAPDIDAILSVYNRYAVGVSVLADKTYFGGSLQLVQTVAQHSPHPVLCKEFIIDPIQVRMARHAGAEAVLLIVKILSDEMLFTLHQAIQAMGMTAIVEVQNEAELNRALSVSPQVLLINNRNLETMVIDLATTPNLIPLIPKGVVVISASGISERTHFAQLRPHCENFLIGSALMKHPPDHIESVLQGWLIP